MAGASRRDTVEILSPFEIDTEVDWACQVDGDESLPFAAAADVAEDFTDLDLEALDRALAQLGEEAWAPDYLDRLASLVGRPGDGAGAAWMLASAAELRPGERRYRRILAAVRGWTR
jgi:hypothetical protein